MQASFLVACATALAFPLACAESPDAGRDTRENGSDGGSESSVDDATSTVGHEPDGGGVTTGDESTTSDGVVPPDSGTTSSGDASDEVSDAEAGPGASDEAGPGASDEAGAGEAGTDASNAEDLLFVPEGLPNTEVSGEGEGLNLVAFTLLRGTTGLEFYAAVRNDGATPACSAGMTLNFYDHTEQHVATSGGSLHGGRPYRFTDGSDLVITCIAPGEIAMAAATVSPEDLAIEQLAYLRHTFPAFTVDVVPIDLALSLSDVETVERSSGMAYTGVFTNGFDVTVSDPGVTIFPVNRVGRPLGMATSRAVTELPPGGSWTFETSTVDDIGVDYVAYTTASIPF